MGTALKIAAGKGIGKFKSYSADVFGIRTNQMEYSKNQ
jgi:hypothetical protein